MTRVFPNLIFNLDHKIIKIFEKRLKYYKRMYLIKERKQTRILVKKSFHFALKYYIGAICKVLK